MIHSIHWGWDTDALGRPLALVVFTDRTHRRYYHDEFALSEA